MTRGRFAARPAALAADASVPADASAPVVPAARPPAVPSSPGSAVLRSGRPTELLTVKEAAARLGMAVPTFYRHLPRLYDLGLRSPNRLTRTRLFDARSVDALLWKQKAG